jgi:hypothetical protein
MIVIKTLVSEPRTATALAKIATHESVPTQQAYAFPASRETDLPE